MSKSVTYRRRLIRQVTRPGSGLIEHLDYWHINSDGFTNLEITNWFRDHEIKYKFDCVSDVDSLDFLLVFNTEQEATLFSIKFGDKFYCG